MKQKRKILPRWTPSEKFLNRRYGFRKQVETIERKGVKIVRKKTGNQIGDFLASKDMDTIHNILDGKEKLVI